MKIERMMTDNGVACRSRRFVRLRRRLKIKHLRSKPCTPRTHGKAKRFIQTLLREWADAYRLCISVSQLSCIVRLSWRPGCIMTTSIALTRPQGHRATGPQSTCHLLPGWALRATTC
ncbi:hypothetical protein CK623_02410 [Vandammella animalimorsus]|uniref:Integrase catalytic domain-containing protein n=1 Tax=Vandammella animalimorsus TaxID=2029117 RepID=A0A2A2ATS3_9BURK|nr:hypothetical protein CK623_02410 [Vandammella animalimorsus]